jgi:hypothetical protein
MVQRDIHVEDPWVWGGDAPKTSAEKFFEAYAHAVETRTFADTSTQWYGDLTVYRSETGKVFYGPEEMKQWMSTLFFSFEKVEHLPEHYLEVPNSDGTVKVHASFQRRLWLKGNTGTEPDIDTPMAWMCTIGPAVGTEGYLGLHFRNVSLYWDKTRTVQLLGKALPSDQA